MLTGQSRDPLVTGFEIRIVPNRQRAAPLISGTPRRTVSWDTNPITHRNESP